jgi:integrator complex subunit 6
MLAEMHPISHGHLSGLTTRGLHVEGVNNDGVNVHHYNPNQKVEDEPLIILAGVGANATHSSPIARMGDFKERLNFAPTLFVDYCGRGAAVTTASDGSPKYSVDDDVLPLHFFDTTSGEFIDSPQVRSRARLTIDCGNVSFIMYLLLVASF